MSTKRKAQKTNVKAYWTAKQAARLVGVIEGDLVHLARVVEPTGPRVRGGLRFYAFEDISALRAVVRLVGAGVPLPQMVREGGTVREREAAEVRDLCCRGFAAVKGHNYEEALKLFEAAVFMDGTCAWAWHGHAHASLGLGDYAVAVAAGEQALALVLTQFAPAQRPSWIVALHYNLAHALEKIGARERAVAAWKLCLEGPYEAVALRRIRALGGSAGR